jgi:hypothetical protein
VSPVDELCREMLRLLWLAAVAWWLALWFVGMLVIWGVLRGVFKNWRRKRGVKP